MKKSTAVFSSVLCFLTGSLIGIILGFLVSPAKQGIGNYISHKTTNIYGSGKNDLNHTEQKKA